MAKHKSMAFEGLPEDVDFMAAVHEAAAYADAESARLVPVWVYDPYEGLPFYHAVASLTKDGYDDAECERSEWRVRLPDGYAVDWNSSETMKCLFRDGSDIGAVPEISLTSSGHAGKHVLFYFDDDKTLSLPLLPVDDK